jgi:GMP synthase (glutamine-hydrolysing)
VVPILVLKMGSTLPALKARRGDFEDWIISGLGVPRQRVSVVDVSLGQPLPPLNGHAAIVVTGSHTMVTEQKEWSEQAAAWLTDAVHKEMPVLGICYGHQLLAHALGGDVGNNPNGREFGTVEVALQTPAHTDPLLEGLPRRIRVHVGHTQSVLRLPAGAIRLASNPWDANQAVRFGPAAWGVQFHPEFDADIVGEYIEHYRDLLAREGQDPDALIMTTRVESSGSDVLRKFARLVRGAGD